MSSYRLTNLSDLDWDMNSNDLVLKDYNLYSDSEPSVPETDSGSIPWVYSRHQSQNSVVVERNLPWLLHDIQNPQRCGMAHTCTDDSSDDLMDNGNVPVEDIGQSVTVETMETISLGGSDVSDDGYSSFTQTGYGSDAESVGASTPQDDVNNDATVVENNASALLNSLTGSSSSSCAILSESGELYMSNDFLTELLLPEDTQRSDPDGNHGDTDEDCPELEEAPPGEQACVPLQPQQDSDSTAAVAGVTTTAVTTSPAVTTLPVPQFDKLLGGQNTHISSSAERSVYQETTLTSSDDDDIDTDTDYRPAYKINRRARLAQQQRRTNSNISKVRCRIGKRSRRKCQQLWCFLLDSLCDQKRNPTLIRWEDKANGIFKVMDTKKLPKLWGERAGIKSANTNMNYEKFSRAIRYYYKTKVINSVSGRLQYQFGPNADGWRARANSSNFGDGSCL